MVCVSADNPAVTTVLELTEANCVPSNQNITVKIETKAGVTPHEYARDMAITAVMCFIGENPVYVHFLNINHANTRISYNSELFTESFAE